MNRTIFVSVLVAIALISLIASLPAKFYQPNEKTFFIATIVVSIVILASLILFFFIPT